MSKKTKIAKTFLFLIKRYVGEESYRRICIENSTVGDGMCATGDYCDSNLFMAAAMMMHGRLPIAGLEPDEVGGILRNSEIDSIHNRCAKYWNETWDIAKQLTIEGYLL